MGDTKKRDKNHSSVLSELNESNRKPSDNQKDKSDTSVLSELNDSDRK